MKKLTLAILFVAAVVITATGAQAGSPRSQSLRAAFEAAKANHRAEMRAIRMEAVLMSDVTSRKKASREAFADAGKDAEDKPVEAGQR